MARVAASRIRSGGAASPAHARATVDNTQIHRRIWGLSQMRPKNSKLFRAQISPALRGSTNRAAPPATSGRHDVFDVITGMPAAIACATGNPKPSYKDG